MDWVTQGMCNQEVNYQSITFKFYFRQGWASAIAALRPPHVKVVCPTADTMSVTLNAGFRMPSWFDLKSLDAGAPEDEEGMYLRYGGELLWVYVH